MDLTSGLRRFFRAVGIVLLLGALIIGVAGALFIHRYGWDCAMAGRRPQNGECR